MEKKAPLITTIIPTYKRPYLLKRAIQSALKQSFSNIQVCVYDNASGDETREVVLEMAKNDSRIGYFCHPSTIPARENFQFALSQLETPFFSILADDDLLGENFYEVALNSFKRFSAAFFFLGSTIDIKEKGTIIGANALYWKGEYFVPPTGIYPIIHNYFNWTGALFRKEILQSVQIDTDVAPIDFDFVLRLAALFPFVISKQPCAIFTSSPHSYSVLSGAKLFWPSWLKIMANLDRLLPTLAKKEVGKVMQQKLEQLLFKTILIAASEGKIDEVERTLEILKENFNKNLKLKLIIFLVSKFKKKNFFACFTSAFLIIFRFRKFFIRIKYKKFVNKTFKVFE